MARGRQRTTRRSPRSKTPARASSPAPAPAPAPAHAHAATPSPIPSRVASRRSSLGNLWFTATELNALERHSARPIDNSLTSKIGSLVLGPLVPLLPARVAPNVLSLAALLCLVQAWIMCLRYGTLMPMSCSISATLLTFAFWALDRLEAKHAKHTRNDSPVTILFAHISSTVGTIFLVLTVCALYNVTDTTIMWYAVQTGQLILLHKHLGSFVSGEMSYRLLNGPGEALFSYGAVLLLRALFELKQVERFVAACLARGAEELARVLDQPAFDAAAANANAEEFVKGAWVVYVLLFVAVAVRASRMPPAHAFTRNCVLACLFFRFVPIHLVAAALGSVGAPGVADAHTRVAVAVLPTYFDVVGAGLSLCFLTTEVFVARMAKRQIHPLVPVFVCISGVSNFASASLAVFYFISLFIEICSYTQLPILTQNINVYCDGIFDMCHIGHMRAFNRAAAYGTRLFVGVCNDESATPYKRAPIMSAREREVVVASCQSVYRVISNAPCAAGELTEEFIREHNIHICVCGEEYNVPTDKYYAVPRRMGILRTTPRSQGMSTSELIRRIQERGKNGKQVMAASE